MTTENLPTSATPPLPDGVMASLHTPDAADLQPTPNAIAADIASTEPPIVPELPADPATLEQTVAGEQPINEVVTEPGDGKPFIGDPNTLIKDKDAAAEHAYAYKPFFDADLDHWQELSDEVAGALEWLGTAAAEKAMAKYEAGKKEMTEGEQAILEKAATFKTIVPEGSSDEQHDIVAGRIQTYPNNNEAKSKALTTAEKALSLVIDLRTQEIMDREDLSDRDKLRMISSLGQTQEYAKNELGMRQGGGSYPENPVQLIAEWQHYGQPAERLTEVLWGMFAGKLGRGGQETYAIAAIEGIARVNRQSFEEVFNQVSGLVSEVAATSAVKPSIDSDLERLGYLWSGSKQQYVRMAD